MSKRAILFLTIIIVVTAYAVSSWYIKEPPTTSKIDLDRPLVVGLVSWPGYAGGIVANDGFKENPGSIFYKKYGLLVRFVLIEDIDARGKAFAKGGPDGVDVVWSTIDFWANEFPNFIKGGINGRAFLQVDWSRGGDAIVADDSIKSIEDLKNRKIALVQFTPSHWLLETLLRQSQLTQAEQQKIRDGLIFTQDVPSARSAFVAGHTDAAVVWEPDVQQALKRRGSHILVSSRDVPNLIADVMVAKKEFIDEHPRAIESFVHGWFDGVEEAQRNSQYAAQLLVENEPLFQDLGIEATKQSLAWVYWANLTDNAQMFGLNGNVAQFDSIFSNASKIWQSLGAIQNSVNPEMAKDVSALRSVYQKTDGE